MRNLAVPACFADVPNAFRAAREIVEGRAREEYRRGDRFLIPPTPVPIRYGHPARDNAFTLEEVVLLDKLGRRWRESGDQPGLAPLVLIPIADPNTVEIVDHDAGGDEVIDLT